MKDVQTRAYHRIQKAPGLAGFTKIYRVERQGTAIQPDQSQLLQTRAYKVLEEFVAAQAVLLDARTTKDYANTETTANVVVDGNIMLANAPPTLLLSIEKMVTDLRTFLNALPVLPPDEQWHYDPAQDCYVSEVSEQTRVEQVKEGLVLYPHQETSKGLLPAQTQIVENSHVVGIWTTTKFSGAVTLKDKEALVARAQKLVDAVKMALHEANAHVTEDRHPAQELLGYVTEVLS
jgi:hypothetical protein